MNIRQVVVILAGFVFAAWFLWVPPTRTILHSYQRSGPRGGSMSRTFGEEIPDRSRQGAYLVSIGAATVIGCVAFRSRH